MPSRRISAAVAALALSLMAVLAAGCRTATPQPASSQSVTRRSPAHAPASAATTHIWMQNGYTATSQFPIGDPSLASTVFNRPGSYGTSSSTSSGGIYNGYATTPCLRYTSDAQLESDIANHVIPNATWPAGSCVAYDIEGWSQTPTNEQQNPERYLPQFNADVSAIGDHPVTTPALNLGNVDTTCPKSSHGGTNVLWYEQCHIAKYAVMNGALGMDVQSQTQVGSSCASFHTLYVDAKADANGQNPSAFVLAEVSVNYGTATQATNCLRNIGKANVQGVFLVDTNSDAATPGGWEDTVLTTLVTSQGW